MSELERALERVAQLEEWGNTLVEAILGRIDVAKATCGWPLPTAGSDAMRALGMHSCGAKATHLEYGGHVWELRCPVHLEPGGRAVLLTPPPVPPRAEPRRWEYPVTG